MKLVRNLLKIAVVALGIFCAFMIAACVNNRNNDNVSTWEVRSCNACGSKNYGLGYTLNDDGESYSLSFVGWKETKVVVPADYKGKPVTKIASGAFVYKRYGYHGLTIDELTLPATITEIEKNAFLDERLFHYYPGSIGTIYFNGTVEQWLNISFGSAPYSNATKLYIGGELLEEVNVPESVTEIGEKTFYNYSALTKITIHNRVTKIGANAFRNCGSLQEVSLGAGITSIPSYAFAGCENLNVVDVKGVLTELGEHAFDGCVALAKIDLSKAEITEIPSDAFCNCYNLSTFVVPASVTQIDSRAFYGCEKLLEIYNLSNLNITRGSEEQGFIAFFALVINTSLDVPSAIVEVGDYVFFNGDKNILLRYTGSDEEIILPENLDGESYSLIRMAFAYNEKITAVTFPYGVTGIDSEAFYECRNLSSVTFSNSLKTIGLRAFAGCSALENVEFPEGLEWIGDEAFLYTGIKSVNIPASTTKIYKESFGRLLEYISVADGNSVYSGAGNCVVEIESKTLIMGCKNSVIPDDGSVTKIGDYAFEFSKIASVIIPEGVTTIGKYAFNSCHELTELSLPKSLIKIDDYAFDSCQKLETINYAGTHAEWDNISNSAWLRGKWIQTSDDKFKM